MRKEMLPVFEQQSLEGFIFGSRELFNSHLVEALLPEVGPCCKRFVTRHLPANPSSILATSQV
jgi:hypothetical protein